MYAGDALVSMAVKSLFEKSNALLRVCYRRHDVAMAVYFALAGAVREWKTSIMEAGVCLNKLWKAV